ncbi:MAG: methyl-accepting chemotaxis protein signaling domain protein [Candidatus Magnetoglobus multicellularis str. Araruama]|uniref:Methyl-accepting chemotaxis protein signaling domain protein n=1 Tax=Candidatus Magnetoglobus multicellularis str. Araruama TaxID=890399 RepID=A0A1V1P778_9BACT|nr:MAG: methyl-accepting chemotaxis protein signaling domain protein [Candidatus Magnetoglobus multicellularis str. Araruama]
MQLCPNQKEPFMIQLTLRAKILSGYLIITFLILVVVIISFIQFVSLGDRLKYLKDEVSRGVIIANDIRSEVLAMRTSVDKFLYLHKDKDLKRAQKHIERVNELLINAKQNIKKPDQVAQLRRIEDTCREFIDKFNKVAIRITAGNNTKKELFKSGKKIEAKLNNIVVKNQESFQLDILDISLKALKQFIKAELEVNSFLLDKDPEQLNRAVKILNSVLDTMETQTVIDNQSLIYNMEDYLDNFEGLAAVILKMEDEINKTILPLAPKIVKLSKEIAVSGWNEMEKFSHDVEDRVRKTGKLMLSIGILAILLGFTMGIFLARMIIKPIIKVVDFAGKVSKGDISRPLNIKQKDEMGQMAEALNNILIDMMGTQQKLMNNLDRLPTPVIEVDKDFTILSVNQEGARIVNQTPSELTGRKCYEIYASEHCLTDDCALQKAMKEDAIFTSETIVQPDIMNMPIRYTGFPVKDNQGIISGAVKYVLDISGEQEINAEIKKLIKAVNAGELNNRADNQRFIGSYAELVENANGIVEAFIKPLNESHNVLKQMANGDLSVRMEGDYQGDHAMMKNSINNVLSSFNSILKQVESATDDVAGSSSELASFSQSLSEGSQEQAASVEQISASIHETDQQINMNADNAAKANQLADDSVQAAISGKEEMTQMISSMEEIHKSSQNISKVINVINEIASQTNILALNATVEAVRAGQFGKSFAVIAQEVRNLAGRSAQAVNETAELIATSNKKVNEGVNIAERTAAALEKIVENIVKVRDLVEDINVASKEQAVAMSQLNDGMGQISAATENMSTRSQETAGSAVQLKNLASELKEQISKFKLCGDDACVTKISSSSWEKEKSTTEHIDDDPSETNWKPPNEIIPLDQDERGYDDF